MQQSLQPLDYAIMLGYFLFTMGLGVYLGRNIKTGKDYFLAGRSLPWWAIGMSLVVSDIGGVDIVGLAGEAYEHGLVLGNFDWLGSVPVMIIAGFVFIPLFWRSGAYTIPEFLGRRYNSAIQTIVSGIWLVVMVFNLGIMLYATAAMMKVMLGWPEGYSIVLSAVFVGLYTIVGGLSAVVYTDVIQCIVMMVGCAIALVIGINDVGGLSGLRETILAMGPQYENHFDLVRTVDTHTDYPWTGVLMGLGFVLAPAYWIGNQAIVQRSLGARTEFEAKASFIWGSLLKIFIPILMVIPGIVALAHNPNVENINHAVPILIRDTLPTGLLGIFFAAFLAAFMSSVDTSLNSSVTLLTTDFYKKFLFPNAGEKHLLLVGRLLTIVFILWGIGFAFWVWARGEGIYTIIQTIFSLYQGPSLSIIILGVLWSRTTGAGALVGLLSGIGAAAVLHFTHNALYDEALGASTLFQYDDPFLLIAWWAFAVSFVVTIIVSLLTPREPEEKLDGLVYKYGRSAA
ncbi:MAG: sodium/solute symporter [Candidatus Hinthialibacter antarcticus]|nr:sodium/solute symporter [Candidatus Hinthialibacter antarcticus]